MAEPFLGEIRLFPYDSVPEGWLPCSGQTLPIAANPALFALIGAHFPHTQTTFTLPDMDERTPIGSSAQRPVGVTGGEVHHTLTVQEMPTHGHAVTASDETPPDDGNMPGSDRVLAKSAPVDLYGPGHNVQSMLADACSEVGGPLSHTNVQPFLALRFCIAVRGVDPRPGADDG